ncbi:MAG: hypothetical protein Q7S74_04830 [Nanoarchaeota archaeon]|nr:hypothetical protein [Nanoarchaeota archaeon]
MIYTEKLDYVPEADIIRAYTVGGVKIPILFDDVRDQGITWASLDSLTDQDWHNWMVDRLLLGEFFDLGNPHYSRPGDADGPEDKFIGLLTDDYNRSLTLRKTFLPTFKRGYGLTSEAFLNETIDASKRTAWGQEYTDARKSLLYVALLGMKEFEKYEFPEKNGDDVAVQKHLKTVTKRF